MRSPILMVSYPVLLSSLEDINDPPGRIGDAT